MKKLLDTAKNSALRRLEGLGFSREETEPIVQTGIDELSDALKNLQTFIRSDNFSPQKADDILHGIKGLLYQMGCDTYAAQADALRQTPSVEEIKNWLASLQ